MPPDRPQPPGSSPSFWLFQANPTKFDYIAGLAQRQPGDGDEWLVTRYREQMQVGDRVIIWVAGPEGGIHAEGTLTTIPQHQDGTNAYPTHTEANASYRVRFRYDRILARPLRRQEITDDPNLANLLVLRQPTGTNYRLEPGEWERIQDLIEALGDEPEDDSSDRGGLEAVLPKDDPRARLILTQWLADAIKHAHAESPTTWVLTHPKGPFVRLLIGATVSFELGKGRVGVGIHLPSIPPEALTDIASDTNKRDYAFARVDGGVIRRMSVARFLAHRDVLRPAALRFIELAAAAYPRTPYSRNHAPDVLDELGANVSVTLPTPAVGAAIPAWKIAPGEKGRLWAECLDGAYIGIGWTEIGDLTGCSDEEYEERLAATLAEHPHLKRRGIDQAWRFSKIPIGAQIVANDGTKRVLGIGTVTGPYYFEADAERLRHRLPVRWDDTRERAVSQPSWFKTLIQLSPANFAEILAAPSTAQSPRVREEAPSAVRPRFSFGDLLDRLVQDGLEFPDDLVAAYLLALQAKRFVILSGISGTGKTQLALSVARAFQPAGAVATASAVPEGAPSDGLRLRAQPYMFKFHRMVVPRTVAQSITADAGSGRIQLNFGGDRSESLRWSAQSTATQLLFKGPFREWFDETFAPGDEFVLRVEGEDAAQLRIEPVTAVTTTDSPPPPRRTYEVVAVRPDWTDNRGLLGYYNPITREYQPTPLLRLVLAAAEEQARAKQEDRPAAPYFLVLDEMNLARVEHYFSDFLSCLESGEPMHLHDDPVVEAGESETAEAVPMRLSIPDNLFFTGTVNVDETTSMFSPKVLDRAFVLEFNDVDLHAYGNPDGEGADDASTLRLSRFSGALEVGRAPAAQAWSSFRELLDGALHRALIRLNDRLEPDHRHFGYRVANEIARFVALAAQQANPDVGALWEAFDIAVIAKVLPKLHGTQQEVEDVLASLLAYAVDVESPPSARFGDDAAPPLAAPRLPRAAAKLRRMLRRVRQQGYVSFIE